MNGQLKTWQRVGLLFGLPAGMILVLWYFVTGQQGIHCIFYELTGLYCPGCGSSRAIHAILHGDLRSAFGHNVLLLPLGVPAAGVFLYEYLRIVFPGLQLKAVALPRWVEVGCCALIFAFWILRNIPLCSFLAP